MLTKLCQVLSGSIMDASEVSPWFPNPLVCMQDMVATGTREVLDRLPWDGVGEWLSNTWYWLSRIQYNDPALLVLPALVAVSLTFLRLLLSWMVFKVSAYSSVYIFRVVPLRVSYIRLYS